MLLIDCKEGAVGIDACWPPLAVAPDCRGCGPDDDDCCVM